MNYPVLVSSSWCLAIYMNYVMLITHTYIIRRKEGQALLLIPCLISWTSCNKKIISTINHKYICTESMKEVVWLKWWTRLCKVFMIQRPLTIIKNNLHHETKDNKRWCPMHSIRYMIAYGLNKVIERLAHLCIMQFFFWCGKTLQFADLMKFWAVESLWRLVFKSGLQQFTEVK